MKIVEIAFMYALQQYYCDTCWGDWFALLFVIGIFVVIVFFGIVNSVEESNAEKQRIKREIERRRYEATPEFQKQKALKEKQERESNKTEIEQWKSKYPFLWEADLDFEKSLTTMGTLLPKCNKCSGFKMRIWDFSQHFITLRCEVCKKKHNYDEEYFSAVQADIESDTLFNTDVFTLSNCYSHYINYNNRSYNAPWSNPLYRPTKAIGDRSGMTAAHPETYPYVIHCERTPIVRRKNSKKNIESEDYRSRRIEQSVKDAVWNRDGGKCVECGSNENLEFDHIIPWSKGGANSYRNLQLLCESCNRIKSDKIG